MSYELSSFLNARSSKGQQDEEGNAVYTHTSMSGGSYNIPESDRAELHRLIAITLIKDKQPVHLTEKNPAIKPVTIDIDLKYPIDFSQRQHNEKHIKELLKLYGEAIRYYTTIPVETPLESWVLERGTPYPEKGNMKDGIHILFPDVCIATGIQHLIREYVLKKIDVFLNNQAIGVLAVKHDKDMVVDKGVIDKNNWTLYGCSKPGKKPYVITGVHNDAGGDLVKHMPSVTSIEDLANTIGYLSINNVTEERTYDIKPEHQGALEELLAKSSKKKKVYVGVANYVKKQIRTDNESDDIRGQIIDAKKLISILAQWRADDYNSWIEVGMCLYNINNNLKDVWTEFSKRSDKFQDGDTDRWHSFEKRDLTIGSLHRWARLDNPVKYKELSREMIYPMMLRSASKTSQDVAAVIYHMYRYQYVCMDSKGKKWAEYVNHGWRITDDGMSLKKKISQDVLAEYQYVASDLTLKASQMTSNGDMEQSEAMSQRGRGILDVSFQLRDITFKEKVMKECIIMFYDAKFEAQLNTNAYLLGTENGVYDLSNGVFRAGRPEDLVSISTSIDYPDFDESDVDLEGETSSIPEVQAIFNFMRQIVPKYDSRRYLWLSLASYIKGLNNDEKFHIWTGVGGNGKSKLLELIELALGDYCFKMPIALLTEKRAHAGQATPELSMSRNRRLGSFQEPDEGTRINVGLMKELSGNDKLFVRGLYQEGTIMKPMFSLILLCNHKPRVPVEDEGTWRRLVIIDFTSRFVDNPSGPNEFPKDPYLAQKFPEWAPYFLALLTMWFRIYKKEGLKQPKEISDATASYRNEGDSYTDFITTHFVADDISTVKLDDSYLVYKDWYSVEYSEKAPTRREYKALMTKRLRTDYGKNGWVGWKLRHSDLPDKSIM